jgi:hypothetical protein
MLFFSLTTLAMAGAPDIDAPLKSGLSSAADTAVIVGIEDYAFAPDVPYASRDAAAFYDLLVYARGVPASRVRLLDGGSKEQIAKAVEVAGSEVGAGGTVWVYFAGHGAADASTGARLLLGDDVRADPVAFGARGIPVDEIRTLAGSGGGAVNLIVDACYSGLGRGGDELIAGKRFLVPASARPRTPSALEWSAASADQLSGPLDAVQHGAFTYFAVGALRGWADGHLDGTRDGRVTAEEAHMYVRDALRTVQVVDQVPELAALDSGKRVLAEGDYLEPAPRLDPAWFAAASSGAGGTMTVAMPVGPLSPVDRPVINGWLQSVVDGCVGTHAVGRSDLGTWNVRFKLKSDQLKGLWVLPLAQVDQMEDTTASATHQCIVNDVRAMTWQPGGKVVHKRVVKAAAPAAPAVAAGPAAAAPAATAPVRASVPVAAPVAAPAPTAGVAMAVDDGMGGGASVSMAVDERTGAASVSMAVDDGMGGSVGMGMGVDGMGVGMGVEVSGDLMEPLPRGEPVVQSALPPGQVRLVFRSTDGEWADIRVDGKVVAEIRNNDEAVAIVSPGLHTIAFHAFMSDKPFVIGKLDTAVQETVTFGVDTDGGVQCFDHDGWRVTR